MRPIKFRCWNKTKKKIMYFEGIFNIAPYTEKSTFPQYESCPEYDELELMQFTGLHDSKGIPIYESDILRIGQFLFEVVYHIDAFKIIELGSNNQNYFSLNDVYQDSIVSSNIHETPEFLETK